MEETVTAEQKKVGEQISDEKLFEELISESEKFTDYFEFEEALRQLQQAEEIIIKNEKLEKREKKEIILLTQRARIYRINGEWERALHDYDLILDMRGMVDDRSYIISAYLGKGEIIGNRGDYKEAVDIVKNALSMADELNLSREVAQACYLLGTFYSKVGEATTGKRLLERSLEISESHREEQDMKNILSANYNQLGLMKFRQNQMEEAQGYFLQTINLMENEFYSFERAEALRYMGVTKSLQGDYKSALEYHSEALWIYKQTRYKFGQAKAYNSIGQTCMSLSKLEEAIHFMEKAESIDHQLGADAESANIYGKLGTVYMRREDYDRAAKFFKRDMEMCRKFSNIRAMAFAYHNIGECCIYIGANLEAVENLRQSLELFRKVGDPINEKKVILDLCLAHINEGNLEEAEKIAEKLNQMIPQKEKSLEAGTLKMLMGIIHRHKKDWADSSSCFNECIDLLKGHGKSLKLAEAYYEYGLMCLGINDQEGALSKFREAFKIARHLGLTRQKERYFRIIERIDDLEIVKLLIEETP